MGTMIFELPGGTGTAAARELRRACVAGGPDAMPWPTEVRVESGRLLVRRNVEESGYLVVPWDVPPFGRLMGATTTLAERPDPYSFLVELARGKVHQLRDQVMEWELRYGLQLPEGLAGQVREATRAVARAVTHSGASADQEARTALALAYQAADGLVRLYTQLLFAARRNREGRLDVALACRLGPAFPPADVVRALTSTCNAIGLPFGWREVEPAEADYQWEPWDELLSWAEEEKLQVLGGPLIDFAPSRLPDWLWLWHRDPSSIANFMCDYVETVVKRYRGRVRAWQVACGGNWASVLGLGEDDLVWLTLRLAEVARRVDPDAALSVGIVQPWGEYMAHEDRTHSPFVFADTLLRSGLTLATLDLELVMGVSPRGSYCRDLLDVVRLLELYAELGVPLRFTLGCPSQAGVDAQADQDLTLDAGYWGEGFTPAVQAAWAGVVGSAILCRPEVRGVCWSHLSDAEPHSFPHCGLLDAKNVPKPALEPLCAIRGAYLR